MIYDWKKLENSKLAKVGESVIEKTWYRIRSSHIDLDISIDSLDK